jgi:hypothetical protein
LARFASAEGLADYRNPKDWVGLKRVWLWFIEQTPVALALVLGGMWFFSRVENDYEAAQKAQANSDE